MRKLSNAPLYLWIIAAIAVVYLAIFWFTPLQGDDLAYAGTFAGSQPVYDSIVSLPRWWAFHWFHSNGRIANLLMGALGGGPHIVLCVLCAAGLFIFYYSTIAVVGARKSIWPFVTIAFIYWALPWHDAIYLFDCQLNYAWASAAVMATALIFARGKELKGWRLAAAALFCLLAGAWHEGATLPLFITATAYIVLGKRWRTLTRAQRVIFIAFGIGVAEVTLCPGIIMRAARVTEPDAPLPRLLLVSDWLALALWAALAVWALSAVCLGRRGKSLKGDLRQFFTSPSGLYAVGALLSMVISGKSGIIGRSGWFAQLFAFVAIAHWLSQRLAPRWRALAVIVSAVTVIHLVATLRLWVEIKKEFDTLESLYLASPDGVVYMDHTHDSDLPTWALGRVVGIPDADDDYLLSTYRQWYGPQKGLPVVMPVQARGKRPEPGSDVTLPHGERLTTSLPQDARPVKETGVYALYDAEGRGWIVQPVRGYYYVSNLELDWGYNKP